MLNQVRTWATAAGAAVLCASMASAQYSDNFESYPASSGGTTFTPGGLANSGGWRQWDSTFNEETKCYTTGGPVAAHSGTQYIGTQLLADTIKEFTTYTTGHWIIHAWTYVPGPTAPQPMLDTQWFVLLNDYNDLGPYTWATQVVYDPVIGEVRCDNGYSQVSCVAQWGIGTPMTFDAWKETTIDVDVDTDVAQVYYDGTPLGDPFSWSQGPFGQNGGAGLPCPPPPYSLKAIGCFDLYANSTVVTPSFMYWDDLAITSSVSAPVAYCTPNSPGSTSGCITSIAATNNPNVGHSNSCVVTVSGVEGQKNGIIFYGLGSNNVPWCTTGGNSFLCVKSPTSRTGSQSSGGTAGACDGSLSVDWNAFQIANPGSLGQPWAAGAKAYVQGWFRDPPACKTTFLSQALEMTYVP